ncbi:MAG: hypothetical protein H6551_05470 [Chitinophagales bacterium]|nr:hypothetical protein [Chitinophagaceae bacterium]MCB9064579.1 hypothetical protein [Chitinophagales bacterium]
MKQIAQQFGQALDKDDFATTRALLTDDCVYVIGDETLTGPVAIANSYEDNMIAGRKKLDKLVWGESRVEPVSDNEYYVHFTDYLTHQGKEYTHRCKQKVTVNLDNKIERIEHIHDEDEQARLDEYYRSVGLK